MDYKQLIKNMIDEINNEIFLKRYIHLLKCSSRSDGRE